MNKSIVRVALVITMLSGEMVYAATSQFRTPLTFLEKGSIHYPLDPIENAWWFDLTKEEKKDKKWYVESFKGFYGRTATKSFFDECNPCENKATRETVSLSTLWFGQEIFRGEDVFPGGILKNPCDPALVAQENISLGFSRITPRFEYSEFGVYGGVDAHYTLGRNNQWHIGARASMPFKDINIYRDQDCQLYETINDVVRMREISADLEEYDFAARFDFLNTLSYPNETGECQPFVAYNEEGHVVSVGGTGISGDVVGEPGVAAFAMKSGNGRVPNQPFRKSVEDNQISVLPESGALGTGGIAFFQNDIDYDVNLGVDRDAQGKLFIVPRADASGEELTDQSSMISQQLQLVLEQVNGLGVNNPVAFFRQNGNIDLCASDRITGQGDLFTEIYGGYVQKNWFADGIIGLRLPTGTKTDEVNRIYLQSTGNNGHVEIKLGVDGGWRVCRWFAFEVDAAFYHAFTRTEQRAAPYKGATVKNIGPSVGVDISWNYVTAHANLNFFHPHNPDLGCTFSYDFFSKSKNKVCVKCPPPADLLGRPNDSLPKEEQGYDQGLLSRYTNSLTHTFRGEAFHRWNFCEIFAGASQVFAGRNAMKETEAYIGMTVYF